MQKSRGKGHQSYNEEVGISCYDKKRIKMKEIDDNESQCNENKVCDGKNFRK